MDIGGKIKNLRIKNNLTQEELGNRAELTKGFISQVERGLTSPSIASLMDILECLGTNLKDFFSETENDKIVFKKKDYFIKEEASLKNSISWIVPNALKNAMEPIIIHIKKNGESDRYAPCNAEVFGYVLAGDVVLHLGEASFKAKKGESFYYKANTPHYLENKNASEASVLWVMTPPNF